ncbi:hypothetical protein pkur_cds_21 [Pandoravirus kuranda]|uniref:Rho binding incomplete domain containing protein n=1 Tax=Pandoravirus kuranda TaxID=3019033 RepID=A0AA95EBU3_9VIRU|nr:hypothetical protein pkur_cds_21 [Pandoravirus kuranda]
MDVVSARPSRNPRFDRKRSRSRSPTVARSLSPPRSRRHQRRRRSPSPSRDMHDGSPSPMASSMSRRAKRQRTVSTVSKGDGETRTIVQVTTRRNHAKRNSTTQSDRVNNNRRVDGARRRLPVPVDSWADDTSGSDDDRDNAADDKLTEATRDRSDNSGDDGDGAGAGDDDDYSDNQDVDCASGSRQSGHARTGRAPSPCLVPDSEEERNADDDRVVDDCESDGSDDEEQEERDGEQSTSTASLGAATRANEDERTRALRTLASTTFVASGPGGRSYTNPRRRNRCGKGAAERRRIKKMQRRLGIDVHTPTPAADAVAHTDVDTAGHKRTDNGDRRAQRETSAVVPSADRHRQHRGQAGRHQSNRHQHHHHQQHNNANNTVDEEIMRRRRISTIDAKKHIEAYHEACRRACIDRVPPPPPPPENMFALVSDAVDLFLAGRTRP